MFSRNRLLKTSNFHAAFLDLDVVGVYVRAHAECDGVKCTPLPHRLRHSLVVGVVYRLAAALGVNNFIFARM
jgi:hypothetical protein